MKIQFVRKLRREMTDAERWLWRRLRLKQVEGYKFRRQHPVGGYVVDFVCLERKIIVEIDGGQHTEHLAYDSRRSGELRSRGFRIVRFWNHEVLNDIDAVLEVIRGELMPSSESSPHPNPPPAERGEGRKGIQ